MKLCLLLHNSTMMKLTRTSTFLPYLSDQVPQNAVYCGFPASSGHAYCYPQQDRLHPACLRDTDTGRRQEKACKNEQASQKSTCRNTPGSGHLLNGLQDNRTLFNLHIPKLGVLIGVSLS